MIPPASRLRPPRRRQPSTQVPGLQAAAGASHICSEPVKVMMPPYPEADGPFRSGAAPALCGRASGCFRFLRKVLMLVDDSKAVENVRVVGVGMQGWQQGLMRQIVLLLAQETWRRDVLTRYSHQPATGNNSRVLLRVSTRSPSSRPAAAALPAEGRFRHRNRARTSDSSRNRTRPVASSSPLKKMKGQ